MSSVIVDSQQPKEKVIIPNTGNNNVLIDDTQPKNKVIIAGQTEKTVSIDNDPDRRVISASERGPKGDPGGFSKSDAAALELELQYEVKNPTNFKEATYDVNELLTNLSVYTDSGKATKLFNKDGDRIYSAQLGVNMTITPPIQ